MTTDSKYCKMVFNGKIIGFANAQSRAKAFALINSNTQKLSPDDFVELLRNNSILCSVPQESKIESGTGT